MKSTYYYLVVLVVIAAAMSTTTTTAVKTSVKTKHQVQEQNKEGLIPLLLGAATASSLIGAAIYGRLGAPSPYEVKMPDPMHFGQGTIQVSDSETCSAMTFTKSYEWNDDTPREIRPWMTELKDTVKLGALSIPGTHDSAASKVIPAGMARCQLNTIEQQISAGIRAFDFRFCNVDSLAWLKNTRNKVANQILKTATLDKYANFKKEDIHTAFCHGADIFSNMQEDPKNVLKFMRQYLQDNKGEFFIIRMKTEDGSTLPDAITSNCDMKIKQATQSAVSKMTVAEARGKIICFDLDKWTSKQDEYNVADDEKLTKKQAAALKGLQSSSKSAKTLRPQFMSAAHAKGTLKSVGKGSTSHTPKRIAAAMNSWFAAKVHNTLKRVGMVFFDYPSYGNIALTISCNGVNLKEPTLLAKTKLIQPSLDTMLWLEGSNKVPYLKEFKFSDDAHYRIVAYDVEKAWLDRSSDICFYRKCTSKTYIKSEWVISRRTDTFTGSELFYDDRDLSCQFGLGFAARDDDEELTHKGVFLIINMKGKEIQIPWIKAGKWKGKEAHKMWISTTKDGTISSRTKKYSKSSYFNEC